jgi:hypothetical protein
MCAVSESFPISISYRSKKILRFWTCHPGVLWTGKSWSLSWNLDPLEGN